MNTVQAKQLIGLVKGNLQGNAESYYRAKYVTYYGKTVFELKSTSGREWFVSINLLDPERWQYITEQAVALGIFHYTAEEQCAVQNS